MRRALLPLLLCVAAGCSTYTAAPPKLVGDLSEGNDVFRVHFIDIGQGLSALLEFPCAAVLIDAGGEHNDDFRSSDALEAYLDAFFARRADLKRTLALVLATHPHLDHTRGFDRVVDRYRVLNVVTNGMTKGSGGRQQAALQAWAQSRPDVGYRAITVDEITDPRGLTGPVIDPVSCDSIDPLLRVVWGRLGYDPGWGGNRYGRTRFANANNHSVVLRVDFGEASALFPGDLEPPAVRELLQRSKGLRVLDVDLYQVSHHGSSNGTTPALVRAMSPEIAIMPTGPPGRHTKWSAWQHGHPRMRVLKMLERGVAGERDPINVQVGVKRKRFVGKRISRAIYATGWDGTVVAEGWADGGWRVLTSGR